MNEISINLALQEMNTMLANLPGAKSISSSEHASGIGGSAADKSALLREGLRVLIEHENAGRLSCLGGAEPHLQSSSHRQSKGR
jgi:hypothetical protein